MQVAIKAKQVKIGETLRQHIDESIVNLSQKYFNNPIEGSVTLAPEGPKVKVDITVHVGRGIQVHSQGTPADAGAAFETASAHMDKRLRRHKRRLRDHRRHPAVETAAMPAQQYVLSGEHQPDSSPETEADTDWKPVVVAEMTTRIESLSVEEAVMHLDLADAPVLMFRNAGNNALNVAYRRTDSNIGWIDPTGNAGA
jgi:ribosomal subunit interface protein